MLRPEQIRIAEDGPIRGVVVDTDYFGPETTVRLKLAVPPELAAGAIPDHRYPGGGEVITIRHWNASIARPGTELLPRVVGEPWHSRGRRRRLNVQPLIGPAEIPHQPLGLPRGAPGQRA